MFFFPSAFHRTKKICATACFLLLLSQSHEQKLSGLQYSIAALFPQRPDNVNVKSLFFRARLAEQHGSAALQRCLSNQKEGRADFISLWWGYSVHKKRTSTQVSDSVACRGEMGSTGVSAVCQVQLSTQSLLCSSSLKHEFCTISCCAFRDSVWHKKVYKNGNLSKSGLRPSCLFLGNVIGVWNGLKTTKSLVLCYFLLISFFLYFASYSYIKNVNNYDCVLKSLHFGWNFYCNSLDWTVRV